MSFKMADQQPNILDCGHSSDCIGVAINLKFPDNKIKGVQVCHSCALNFARDHELSLVVDWLKDQSRFGLPKFVISYLEKRHHRDG